MNDTIKKYLLKRAENKWKLQPTPKKNNYSFVICIPSYCEDQYIDKTLNSICNQNSNILKKTLIIIVINNGPNKNRKTLESNLKTIAIIKSFSLLNICIVDAFTSGNELPQKQAGVGLARKIGLDLSLKFCDKDSILCNLDADTIISPYYLKTIEKYYKQNNSYAAVINFSHYQSKNQKLTEAIKVYEKFIKHTSKNLKKSNSPYYYHSIGSTITSTALAYAAVGGMTKKIATEDFYFLESLSKYRSVDIIEDILVFPSSRISDRVYLGTGYRMKQSNSGFDLNKLFFNDQIFILLKKWLELGTNCKNKHINFVLMEAKKIHSDLPIFLNNEKIKNVWIGLQKSSPTEKHFIMQFHRWFDALKTLRFLKYYSKIYP